MEVGGDNKSWCAILGISHTKAWEGGGKGDGRRENFISKDQNKRWSRLRQIVSSRGGKRGRRFPRWPERSGVRGLCGGRDVRGCGGREGARAGAARPAQLCAPASLGNKLLAPGETCWLCGARGGTPAGTPRASSILFHPPPGSPGCGGARCSALRRRRFPSRVRVSRRDAGAQRCAGAAGASGGCQKGPRQCRPPAQLGTASSSVPVPVPPLPRCEAFPARPGVSPPPGVPRSPHCPHEGTPPSSHPSPFLHETTCKVPPTPTSRPVSDAVSSPLPGPSPGTSLTCPSPGWLLRLRACGETVGNSEGKGKGGLFLRDCGPSASPAAGELFRGFSEVGRGSPPSSGEGQLEPSGRSSRRRAGTTLRIPHDPERCSKAGRGFTCSARLFGWEANVQISGWWKHLPFSLKLKGDYLGIKAIAKCMNKFRVLAQKMLM